MTRFLDSVLHYRPTTTNFILASCEIAEANIARECRSIARRDRKQRIRKLSRRWRESVERLVEQAGHMSTAEILSAAEEIPHDAIQCARSLAEAEAAMDEYSRIISQGRCLVGQHEQYLNKEVVLIWLWQDR